MLKVISDQLSANTQREVQGDLISVEETTLVKAIREEVQTCNKNQKHNLTT